MRADAWASVDEFVRRCADGKGGACLIHGMPGMGKTQLLEGALRHARSLGFTVFSGEAHESDVYRPLAPLLRTYPPGSDSGPGSPSERLEAGLEELERAALAAPVVVALDGVDLLDRPTSLALRDHIAQLSAERILWLVASRPVPPGTPAHSLIGWLTRNDHERVELVPLDAEETRRLLGEVLDAEPAPELIELAERCGGNPHLIEHLARSWLDQGMIEIKAGRARNSAGAVPEAPFDLWSLGLDTLTPAAHRLVSSTSVLDRPFTVHEASALSGLSPPQAIEAASEAILVGALAERGDKLFFSHGVAREYLFHSLSPTIRAALHLEATRLGAPPPPPDPGPGQRDPHLGQAVAQSVDTSIAHGILLDTAAHLEDSSPSVAADLILRTLEIIGADHPDRHGLVVRAIRLLALSGRTDDVDWLAREENTDSYTVTERAQLVIGIAQVMKHRGRDREVVELTQEVLAEDGLSTFVRADLLALQAHALMHDDAHGHDPSATAAEARAAAETSGNDAALVRALVAASAIALQQGRLHDALATANEAVERTGSIPGLQRLHAERWQARAFAAFDRFSAAQRTLDEGQRKSAALGTTWSQPMWHFDRGQILLQRGWLDDALTEAETGLRMTDVVSARALVVPLLILQTWCLIAFGKLEDARVSLGEAAAWLESGIVAQPLYAAWTRVHLHHAEGDHYALAASIAEATRDRLTTTAPVVANGYLGVHVVRALVDAEEGGLAAHLTQLLGEVATRNPAVQSRRAYQLHARGLSGASHEPLLEAREAYQAAGLSGSRPWTDFDLGRLLADAGRPEEAIQALRKAERGFARQGASGPLRQISTLLAGLGTTATAPTAEDPWQTLTKSERKVMELVVLGGTNREVATQLFLSPHTVDTHLRHIFQKVGVNSRVLLSSEYYKRRGGGD